MNSELTKEFEEQVELFILANGSMSKEEVIDYLAEQIRKITEVKK